MCLYLRSDDDLQLLLVQVQRQRRELGVQRGLSGATKQCEPELQYYRAESLATLLHMQKNSGKKKKRKPQANHHDDHSQVDARSAKILSYSSFEMNEKLPDICDYLTSYRLFYPSSIF